MQKVDDRKPLVRPFSIRDESPNNKPNIMSHRLAMQNMMTKSVHLWNTGIDPRPRRALVCLWSSCEITVRLQVDTPLDDDLLHLWVCKRLQNTSAVFRNVLIPHVSQTLRFQVVIRRVFHQ